VNTRLGLLDDAGEKRLVDTMDVFHCIDDRKSGFDAEKHGSIAAADVQVHQQNLAVRDSPQRRRRVDGEGGGADAAFRTDEREHLPGRLRRHVGEYSTDGILKRFRCDRIGKTFVDAGPHPFEHQPRIECGDQQHHPRAGVLLAEGGETGRQLIATADVNDEDLGRFSRSAVGGEFGGLDSAGLQPGRAKHVVEPWVGGQNGDLGQLRYLATGSERKVDVDAKRRTERSVRLPARDDRVLSSVFQYSSGENSLLSTKTPSMSSAPVIGSTGVS
jgi:hypothetical protein